MQNDYECPVCGNYLGDNIPAICPVCGWDCGNDITLSLSLNEFSQAEREEYDNRFANAKQLWQKKKDEEEKLRKAEEEEERKLKELAAKCSDLKTLVNGLMRDRKWAEALKLLNQYDELDAGTTWAAEQRKVIHAALMPSPSPKPDPDTQRTHSQTPLPQPKSYSKSRIHSYILLLMIIIVLILSTVIGFRYCRPSQTEYPVTDSIEVGDVKPIEDSDSEEDSKLSPKKADNDIVFKDNIETFPSILLGRWHAANPDYVAYEGWNDWYRDIDIYKDKNGITFIQYGSLEGGRVCSVTNDGINYRIGLMIWDYEQPSYYYFRLENNRLLVKAPQIIRHDPDNYKTYLRSSNRK